MTVPIPLKSTSAITDDVSVYPGNMSSSDVLSKNSVTLIILLVPSVAVSTPSTVITAIYSCFA